MHLHAKLIARRRYCGRPAPLRRGLTRRFRAEQLGFTLIELLVAMLLLAIVLGGIATFIATTYTRANTTTRQSVAQTAVRAAVDTAVADLRQAYYGDGTTSPIVAMSPTALTFYSPDRAQPLFHLRKISYQLVGGLLQRATATSTDTDGPPWLGLTTLGLWATQVDSVTNTAVFTYQDANGAATSDPTKVSRIVVTVQVRPGGQGTSYVYQSSATIRAAT